MANNITSVSGGPGISRLPDARNNRPAGGKIFTSVLIPLLLGLVLAGVAAVLIIQQEWVWLIALAVMVPAVILLFAYPIISILVWLLLFPIFLQEIMPGARYMYWLLHRALIPSALGIVILQSLLGLRKARPFRFGVVDVAMLGFITLSVINILMLTDRPIAEFIRYYDRMLIPFAMYWLFRILAPDERELRWLAPIAAITILVQGAVGFLSWFAPGVLPPEWLSRIGTRTVGTFNNPAVYSTTLVFCSLVLMQAAHLSQSAWKRWVSIAAIGLAFFFVFFTFSRGSWLGAAVVWFGLAFIYPKTILKLSIVGGIAAMLLLLTTPLSGFLDFARDRLFTQSTAEGRIIGGAATARMIEARPLQGWGYGNHELYDEQFRERVLDLEVNSDNSSHNTYLLMTAEMGIPGLLLYFFPAAWLLFYSWRYWHWLPPQGMMSRPMLVMMWLLLADLAAVMAFTDLIRSVFFSTVLWWLALAWIANIVDSARTSVQADILR